jgi:hypothetical protein
MQTFLPYQSFEKSLACLDWRRLGKQRVEAFQILNVLSGKRTGWQNHPAVKMWRGYEKALEIYKDLAILEWRNRGFNNTMLLTSKEIFISDTLGGKLTMSYAITYPLWLTEKFCAAHRSNLLRKDTAWYSQFNWSEPDTLPYIWPVA